jgi:hypothetical protein
LIDRLVNSLIGYLVVDGKSGIRSKRGAKIGGESDTSTIQIAVG